MRICILTQPLDKNFGGLLQAYALQKVLKEMGHEVTTLRFKPLYAQTASRMDFYWKYFRRLLSRIKGNKDITYLSPDAEWQYKRRCAPSLEHFINDKLSCMEASIPLDTRKLPTFDAFIVGSDQVWRPVFSPRLTNFYLDFLKDLPVRRIAYAASFGVDTWEVPKKTTEIIRRLAKRFDRISVREASAVDLCREYLGVEADLMPDPTLLLKREDYLAFIADCPNVQIPSHPYIATYFIDPTDRESSLVADFAREHHLPIINIGDFDWAGGSDPVAHWLSGIANAAFVITDSFHGTVFSLLFQRDFITFDNGWRGSSRFHTLLDTFGMSERLVNMYETDRIVIPAISRESISRQLIIQQAKGRAFLTEYLSPQKESS